MLNLTLINVLNFDKAMENVGKQVEVKLNTQWKNLSGSICARTVISKHNYKFSSIFNSCTIVITLGSL